VPTREQAFQSIVLCHWLSNGFQPINVYRYDAKQKTIYIQAGEQDSIILVIFSNGEWSFYEFD